MENAVLEVEKIIHKSVMVDEAMEYLITNPEGTYVDATVGLGGHTGAILRNTGTGGKVVGLDVDEEVLDIARERLESYSSKVVLRNNNYSAIDKVLADLGVEQLDGIIADLGMSSFQIDSSGRGFSFQRDEPLDMRMDATLRFRAYDLVNEMTVDEITKVLKTYGEERWAKRIAKRVVEKRKGSKIKSSAELAGIVSDAIPNKFHSPKIHPATKTFQAFRIAVNNELENLKDFITKSVSLLKVGGRIAIISFHSLEDRAVKSSFRRFASPCVCPPDLPRCSCGKEKMLKIITPRAITPSEDEVLNNPRSRSAKMRVAERV